MRKVTVTGVGLVTPLGRGVEETWMGLIAGASGVARHERKRQAEYLQYFGQVKGLDKPEHVPKSIAGQVRFLNRGSVLGFEAAKQAVESSQGALQQVPRERRALYIASGDLSNIGCESMFPALRDAIKNRDDLVDLQTLNESAVKMVSPFILLDSIHNNLFSFLSAAFEFMGPSATLASLSPCGGTALELACRAIRTGEADVALAVGCGSWINEVSMFEMDGLGILSKCGYGAASFRPLDRSRDGFIPGEGGAAILLEDAGRAAERGAPVLAHVNGVANCIELPSDNGLSVPKKIVGRSMNIALEDASYEAGDLAFLCPHGSATRTGDRSELESLAEILYGTASAVPVCALKPYTGHMGAASDICEVILGVRAIAEGIVPGTPNFSRTEPEFENLRISASVQKANGSSFLSVSYGILGQSSSVLVDCRTGKV